MYAIRISNLSHRLETVGYENHIWIHQSKEYDDTKCQENSITNTSFKIVGRYLESMIQFPVM